MSALNFPSSPSTNQIYTANGKSWRYDGTSWKTYYILNVQGGGTGNTFYNLGDLLVGAGSSILTLPVGTNNYVLTVDTTTPSLLSWKSVSGISITNINGVFSSYQYFTVGSSGTGFNISSTGATHTFNIPIAGSGSTGLITTLAQTIAGQKTFTSSIIGDLIGTATTSGFASTAQYSYQSGYAITSGLATTTSNVYIANATTNLNHPLIFAPSIANTGVGLSGNNIVSFNPSSNILYTSGLAVTASTTSISSSTGALTVVGGVGIGGSLFVSNSVPSSISNVVFSNGVINSGSWAGSTITSFYGGTGLTAINAGNAFLSSNSAGTALTYRTFTAGSGISFSIDANSVIFSASGSLSGVGTSAYIPLWTSAGTALTNSLMYQSGSVINVAGNIKAQTKSFLIPHPLDSNKLLEHGSLEGPEHGAYLRGTASGKKQVDINFPDYWQPLIEDNYTIHITSKCKYSLYVYSQSSNGFSVRRCGVDFFSNSLIEFDYLVIGERRDTKITLIQDRQI